VLSTTNLDSVLNLISSKFILTSKLSGMRDHLAYSKPKRLLLLQPGLEGLTTLKSPKSTCTILKTLSTQLQIFGKPWIKLPPGGLSSLQQLATQQALGMTQSMPKTCTHISLQVFRNTLEIIRYMNNKYSHLTFES